MLRVIPLSGQLGFTRHCDNRGATEAALRLTFKTRRSRLYGAAAHPALGEVGRAREIVAEATANNSDLATEYVENHEFYRDAAVKRTLIDLLVSAGLPSQAAPNAKAQPASKPV